MPITHNVQSAVFKKLSVRLDSANLAHQDEQLSACLTLSKCFCLSDSRLSIRLTLLLILHLIYGLIYLKMYHSIPDSLSFRDLSKNNFYDQRRKQNLTQL